MNDKALYEQHFNTPMLQICETLKNTLAQHAYDDLNPEPISQYYSSMIAGGMPELVEQNLSDEEIADFQPDQVQAFGLLLFRDMFRRFHQRLRPQTNDISWVDPLFEQMALQHEIPVEALADDGKPYDVKNPNAPWAGSLGALMGLPSAALVKAQGKALYQVQQQSAAASAASATAATTATAAEMPESTSASAAVMDDDVPRRRGGFLTSAPPWLVSSLVHGLILLMLAMYTFDTAQIAKNILSVSPTQESGEEMEEFALDQVEPDQPQEEMVEEPVVTPPTTVTAVAAIEVDTPDAVLMVGAEMPDMVDTIAPLETLTQSLTQAVSATSEFSARSTDVKKELLKKYGGSDATEAAVQNALEWFKAHQLPNGAWSLHHNIACGNKCGNPGDEKGSEGLNGATALALLPFLGAGQTHKQGKYRSVVQRGLMYVAGNMVVKNQKGLITGDCRDKAGNMYSHALCAIVLCEAYAMTHDPSLQKPAQAAINFIVMGQNKNDGGWRYSPGQEGDTSVVGWMVMALKSAHMGHLIVPPNTIRGASLFLDRVSGEGGAYYGYTGPQKKPSTSAVGLLCRMYMGWDKENPALVKGVNYLSSVGYDPSNPYLNYYAAQVLRQYGGKQWEQYNAAMSKALVESQESSGHAKGSWYIGKGHTTQRGGRLACTSLATMTLEVYYRHLPLYAERASEDDFPL